MAVPLTPCKIRLLLTRRGWARWAPLLDLRSASLTSHPGFAFVAALLVSPHRFAFRKRGPNPAYVVGLRQIGVWVWLARMARMARIRMTAGWGSLPGKTVPDDRWMGIPTGQNGSR